MSALLSEDGLYRYLLTRSWSAPGAPRAVFVMLNPSTADATQDDATIRRCVQFAKTWGMGGLTVVNLYALRATQPARLWQHADPVGPDNDRILTSTAVLAAEADFPIVGAWGANAKPARVAAVLGLPGMGRLQCLGTTKAGQPRHPLYLSGGTPLQPWSNERNPE